MTQKANTTPRYPARLRASRRARVISAIMYAARYLIPEALCGLALILFALIAVPLLMAGL